MTVFLFVAAACAVNYFVGFFIGRHVERAHQASEYAAELERESDTLAPHNYGDPLQ